MSYIKAMLQFADAFKAKYNREPTMSEFNCEICKSEFGHSANSATAFFCNSTCAKHGGFEALVDTPSDKARSRRVQEIRFTGKK